MNNSIGRLIEGMAATLRKEVIPHVDGDYARGQAFGVIYMLNSLKLRASWSSGFLLEQLRGLDEAAHALEAVTSELPGVPLPTAHAPADLPDAATLESARDEGDRQICELIDWLADNRGALPAEAVGRAKSIIDRYIERQAKFELSTSAKPMFVEMSGGADKT